MRQGFLIGLVVLLAMPASASATWYSVSPSATVDRQPLPGRVVHDDGRAWVHAAMVGDVDGDGIEDVAALRYGDVGARVVFTRATPAVGEAPELLVRGVFAHERVAPAGDVDGDGHDDLLVFSGDRVHTGFTVVFGRGPGEIDRFDEGAVLQVSSSRPTADPIAIGDQNGDGRGDLAVPVGNELVVLHAPVAPRGQTIALDSVLARLVFDTPADAPVTGAHRLDDVDSDGRDEVLVEVPTPRDDTPVTLVATRVPAGPVTAAVTPGSSWSQWRVDVGRGWRGMAGILGDQNGDGRRDLVVAETNVERYVMQPPIGTDASVNALSRTQTTFSELPRDGGDLDGDGRGDYVFASVARMASAPVENDAYAFDNVVGFGDPSWNETVGPVRDLDGDGANELVVAHMHGDGTSEIAVYRSRGLIDTNPGTPPWRPADGPPVTAPGTVPPVLTPPTVKVRTAQAATSELVAAPEYAAGVVRLKVRAPRGARVTTSAGAASPWRGADAWPLPDAAGTGDGTDPWVSVTVALPPAARAAIERDGRLRLRVTARAVTRASPSAARTFSFVVQTRRAPVAVAPKRALRGGFGVQRLLGAGLDELLSGASGDDVLRGQGGADRLSGGTGNDTLFGGPGNDASDGDDGDDRHFGGPGDDELVEGRFGDDELRGEDGDDLISGGRGEDEIWGGPGDDVLSGGSGPDVVDCGPGEDIVFVNFTAERRRLKDCEHVYEEAGVIHVRCADGGTDGPETVLGTEGADRCAGRGGDDDLEGRGGDDVLDAGAGADRLFGRFGADTLLGGDGDDELEGGRGADVLDGGAGRDRLNGGYDEDVVRGGDGDDRIVARGGGVDLIDCGAGTDVAVVDSRDVVRGCERVDRSGSRR